MEKVVLLHDYDKKYYHVLFMTHLCLSQAATCKCYKKLYVQRTMIWHSMNFLATETLLFSHYDTVNILPQEREYLQQYHKLLIVPLHYGMFKQIRNAPTANARILIKVNN